MIGIVVPAHNEEACVGACLQSLQVASQCPALGGEEVLIVVAADACTDATERIARELGALVVSGASRKVGMARAQGARLALARGARWLAFTDADSVVSPGWLAAQLDQSSDAVCGTIEVRDWGDYGESLRKHHARTYTDVDGHRHVHGANMGVDSAVYQAVGGFQPLESSEDVALVEALKAHGASIAWSAAPRVFTSARRSFRAPLGFGQTLLRMEQDLCESSGPAVA